MDFSKLLERFPRPDKTDRLAELAVLLANRAVTVEPVEAIDAEHAVDSVVYPKAETIAPHLAAYGAKLLVDRAERLHKLAEAECNYGLSGAQERTQERLQAEVVEIAEFFGFRAETSGDPRGAVVRLFDPADERAGDGFGGGWAVYR